MRQLGVNAAGTTPTCAATLVAVAVVVAGAVGVIVIKVTLQWYYACFADAHPPLLFIPLSPILYFYPHSVTHGGH